MGNPAEAPGNTSLAAASRTGRHSTQNRLLAESLPFPAMAVSVRLHWLNFSEQQGAGRKDR